MSARGVSLVALSAGVALAGGLALAPAAPAARGAVHVDVGSVTVYGAPTNAKGGVFGPQVDCTDGSEAVVDWTLTNLGTEDRLHIHFVGYDIPFRRVPVGHYRSRTVATCGEETAARTERVFVWQKTARNTISQSEFNRLDEGMTRQQVAHIVGYAGQAGPSYSGLEVQTYDHLQFGVQAQVNYRHDRAVDLYWEAGVGG